jgi:hypothetical protein
VERAAGGARSRVGSGVPGSIESGRWYDLRVELEGPRIQCYLDGTLVHDLEERKEIAGRKAPGAGHARRRDGKGKEYRMATKAHRLLPLATAIAAMAVRVVGTAGGRLRSRSCRGEVRRRGRLVLSQWRPAESARPSTPALLRPEGGASLRPTGRGGEEGAGATPTLILLCRLFKRRIHQNPSPGRQVACDLRAEQVA